MGKGELNEYTLMRRREGRAEIELILKNPPTYEQALEQTRRILAQSGNLKEGHATNDTKQVSGIKSDLKE